MAWYDNQFRCHPYIQKAEAQLAYELQAAKIQQKIRNEEIQIQVVERRKQIEIEEQEINRKEKELMSTVKLPAESEAYKVQTIAEGKRQVIQQIVLNMFILTFLSIFAGPRQSRPPGLRQNAFV